MTGSENNSLNLTIPKAVRTYFCANDSVECHHLQRLAPVSNFICNCDVECLAEWPINLLKHCGTQRVSLTTSRKVKSSPNENKVQHHLLNMMLHACLACWPADIDECQGDPCGSKNNATGCVDATAPHTGYSCSCSDGFAWDARDDEGGCKGGHCWGLLGLDLMVSSQHLAVILRDCS